MINKKISSEIARVFVGEFYENLFLTIFGGERTSNGNVSLSKPDISKKEEKTLEIY